MLCQIITVLCLTASVVVGGCNNDADVKAVLLDVQQALQIPYWGNTNSNPVCNWTGISCVDEDEGRPCFVGIQLVDMQLSGTLPESLGRLGTRLRQLILYNNSIHGTLPESLSNATNMTEVQLFYNQLTGTIPEAYGNCSAMQYFHVAVNQLTGSIPALLQRWRSIQYFDVGQNQLNGTLPGELSVWSSSITGVQLYTNGFTGTLPSAWNAWVNIEQLSVRSNRLQGTIPNAFLSQSSNLNYLDVSMNGFTGSIPNTFCTSWPKVETMNLYGNQLSGTLPDSLSNCVSMKTFLVNINKLTGTLPDSLRLWSQLQKFYVSENMITGTLPALYSDWSQLVEMQAHYNTLTGTLPSSYGFWRNLTTFYVNSNNLTGSIPREYGSWSSVLYLFTASNQLSGTVPETLSQCVSLKSFHINDNLLSGTLSPSFASWRNLTDFLASRNYLNGTLPNAWSAWTNVELFDVSRNNLMGSIPSLWSSWSTVKRFFVHLNQLSGTFPSSELGVQWRSIESLNISNNQLTGPLPLFPSAASTVHYMMCHSNQFTGTLHEQYADYLSLLWLFLSHNRLVGTLPESYARIPMLRALTISDNLLTGTLHSHFSKQNATLFVLGLHNNLFTGSLPADWGALRLTVLTLHDNHGIRGSIPTSWYNMFTSPTVVYLPCGLLTLCRTKLRVTSDVDFNSSSFSIFPPAVLGLCPSISLGFTLSALSSPKGFQCFPGLPGDFFSLSTGDLTPLLPYAVFSTEQYPYVTATMSLEPPIPPTPYAAPPVATAVSSVLPVAAAMSALASADGGDLQMLASVIGSSCGCAGVAAAASQMSYSTTPFAGLGGGASSFGNAMLSLGITGIHFLVVWIVARGACCSGTGNTIATTSSSSSASTDTNRAAWLQPPQGLIEAALRLQFPSLSVQCALFLIGGAVKGAMVAFVSRDESSDPLSILGGICGMVWSLGVLLALELILYRRYIQTQMTFRHYTPNQRRALTSSVPSSMGTLLLPQGAWGPPRVRKALGLISHLQLGRERVWIVIPLSNIIVQVLAGIPTSSSAVCAIIQGIVMVLCTTIAIGFIAYQPFRSWMQSILAGLSLLFVAIGTLLTLLCRLELVSSDNVTTASMVMSLLSIAFKAYTFWLLFWESRQLSVKTEDPGRGAAKDSQHSSRSHGLTIPRGASEFAIQQHSRRFHLPLLADASCNPSNTASPRRRPSPRSLNELKKLLMTICNHRALAINKA